MRSSSCSSPSRFSSRSALRDDDAPSVPYRTCTLLVLYIYVGQEVHRFLDVDELNKLYSRQQSHPSHRPDEMGHAWTASSRSTSMEGTVRLLDVTHTE